MRQAQLAIAKKHKYRHPGFWAAFIMLGNRLYETSAMETKIKKLFTLAAVLSAFFIEAADYDRQ